MEKSENLAVGQSQERRDLRESKGAHWWRQVVRVLGAVLRLLLCPGLGNGGVFVPMSAQWGEKQAFRVRRPGLAGAVSTQLGG